MDLSVNAARIKMRSPDNVSLSGPLQVTAVAQMKWMVDLNTGLKFPHPSTYCSRRPIQLECVKSGNEDASHQCVCRHPVTQRPRLSEETSPSGSEEVMPI